jgi:hypothetical protein
VNRTETKIKTKTKTKTKTEIKTETKTKTKTEIQTDTNRRTRIERMLGRAGNKTVIGLQVRRRYGTSDSRCTYEIDAENGKEGRVPTYSHITDG